MSTNYLEIAWTISRGRETYGYSICTLRDQDSGKRYRCMGGGYDMTGTVFGEWLQETYQDRLVEIGSRAHTQVISIGVWETNDRRDALYGMRRYDHHVTLDGGCGIDSMRTVAEAIGLEIRATMTRRGRVTGFIVTDTRP